MSRKVIVPKRNNKSSVEIEVKIESDIESEIESETEDKVSDEHEGDESNESNESKNTDIKNNDTNEQIDLNKDKSKKNKRKPIKTSLINDDDSSDANSYYRELKSRSESSLKTYNMSDICTRFSQKLASLKSKLKIEISSWFYYLIRYHRIVVDKIDEKFPYKPRTRQSLDPGKTYFMTYTISKIPSTVLQGILIGFMVDCLNGSGDIE